MESKEANSLEQGKRTNRIQILARQLHNWDITPHTMDIQNSNYYGNIA